MRTRIQLGRDGEINVKVYQFRTMPLAPIGPIHSFRQYTYDDYTIGWVAVLDCELDATRLLLDKEHEPLDSDGSDPNNYILGDMEGHNIAIAYPGEGVKGESVATYISSN